MSGPRILLADDAEFSMLMLSAALQKLGLPEPITAANGREAPARYDEAGDIDLIFTDLYMPDMDGIEFMQGLAERNYEGPVVVMSGVEFIQMLADQNLDAPIVPGPNEGELMLAPGAVPATLNIVRVLGKPVRADDIRAILEEVGLLD